MSNYAMLAYCPATAYCPHIQGPHWAKAWTATVCTAHRGAHGQPSIIIVLVWQLPCGTPAKAKEGSTPDTSAQAQGGVKSMSDGNSRISLGDCP